MSISELYQWYYKTFYENADPRIRDYPLMGLPHKFITIAILLSIFSCYTVPQIFKKYKNLNIIHYQILIFMVQVASTSYIIFHLSNLWLFRYNWVCQPLDAASSPENLKAVDITYKYFLYKLFSISENSYFLVKNRNKYWTNYIVFHHLIMPYSCWIVIQYYPEGHTTFTALINCIILNMIYTYGSVSELFPTIAPKRWTRRITSTLDEAQLAVIALHSVVAFFQKNCNVPGFVISVELGIISVLVVTYIIMIKFKADKIKGEAF
jgi:GNS1/SUR4 family